MWEFGHLPFDIMKLKEFSHRPIVGQMGTGSTPTML
jgi:hypothetical protein